MDTQDTSETRRVQGQVKWFDPSKGFGFVIADLGGPDILLHANVLRNFGQGSVVDGSTIELIVQDTQRGLQATEVLSIVPPQSDSAVPLRDMVASQRRPRLDCASTNELTHRPADGS